MVLRATAAEFVDQAVGRSHRDDPVLGSTGGPAGNARFTAWTGLVLLVLFAAELVTLLDVRGLITWHIALGVLLIPPALVKTVSTGWRIVRYYSGSRPYRAAGPPPLLLRLLGPLVVAFTLAVLGSGTALILVGPDASQRTLIASAGFAISLLLIHKATFVIWGVVTGAHTLGRLIPALRLTVVRPGGERVPGRHWRAAAFAATAVLAVLAAALAFAFPGGWAAAPGSGPHHGRIHVHGEP